MSTPEEDKAAREQKKKEDIAYERRAMLLGVILIYATYFWVWRKWGIEPVLVLTCVTVVLILNGIRLSLDAEGHRRVVEEVVKRTHEDRVAYFADCYRKGHQVDPRKES